MIIVRGRPSRNLVYPVDGNGTDINEGAAVMPGTTADQNIGVVVVASGAAANVIGLMNKKHTANATNDANPELGTVWANSLDDIVPFLPGCEVAAEYSQASADILAVTSATSTVITITNLEDNIDASWIYVVSGTGVGQLEYLTASAAGNCTVKSAMTTTLDNTSKIIILHRKFHRLHTLVTAADKLKTQAAAGSLTWVKLRNEFKTAGREGWIEPDPTVHHDAQFSGQSFVARGIMNPVDTLFNPI